MITSLSIRLGHLNLPVEAEVFQDVSSCPPQKPEVACPPPEGLLQCQELSSLPATVALQSQGQVN